MKQKTGLIIDECFQKHRTGPGHPERPERLVAISRGLAESGLGAACVRLPIRIASQEQILGVHSSEYVARLRNACETGAQYIDSHDSAICPDSFEAALMAAGSILEAVDQVCAGHIQNAFCAVRPPGHHCERSESMGFCLLGNAAIAARHLLDHHCLQRVAIVDWDVHHGNGSQHIFEDSSEVLVCNLHGHPEYVYPGTGFENEQGKGDGKGATLNVPLMPGSGDDDYRRAFDAKILPILEDFKPEFVIISAGFDAHARDPLAPLELQSESFGWMTQRLLEVAADHSGNRLVSVLEGGYDLQALSESVCHHVRALQS
ncbi:MAG: acetoin utilization protein [Phycisphaerae bacterium]|nr:MAG: acetoin utilization protein [Phycisphaerae bacterium]